MIVNEGLWALALHGTAQRFDPDGLFFHRRTAWNGIVHGDWSSHGCIAVELLVFLVPKS